MPFTTKRKDITSIKDHRASGILMHITSLPGPFGIGEAGPEARAFIDFLKEAGQSYWQFLPLGPTSAAFGHSPYMCSSAFAGNPLLISPDLLVDLGLLSRKDLETTPGFSKYLVEFEKVVLFKRKLFHHAFRAFRSKVTPTDFELFCHGAKWLEDFVLYQALKENFGGLPWQAWPRELASRDPQALEEAKGRFKIQIQFHQFLQYCFDVQWKRFKKEAHERGIRLIGDLPIYVAPDSADVWANQDCFLLDPDRLTPSFVAGVPPDYFSKTGQRWGNPIYRWSVNGQANQALYRWWLARLKRLAEQVDVIRIDHFRGFEAYWSIPASEKTAVNGKWIKGPGKNFFDAMAPVLKELEVIAEDLGTITPEVIRLRDEMGFPGMKVLQFAFDSDEKNLYLPHNYDTTNCVVYTGTHDNDTTVGWYLDPNTPPAAKARAVRYAHSDGSAIHWDFVRMALSSIACLAVIPTQDILGFGSDCRMNHPSTTKGNWIWRCAPEFLTDAVAASLHDETKFYARTP